MNILHRSNKIKWLSPEIEGVTFHPMSITPIVDIDLCEDDLLYKIGLIAGTCYNSSAEIQKCQNRALSCIARGHHSPWEHHNITLDCVVNRSTSHALVRHRHCAFQQGSTIYQNYKDDIPILKCPSIDPFDGKEYHMCNAEIKLYSELYKLYAEAKEVGINKRNVLPINTATRLVITTNIREWMYIIQRRCGPGDSVYTHVFALLVYEWFEKHYPKILSAFNAWYEKHPL